MTATPLASRRQCRVHKKLMRACCSRKDCSWLRCRTPGCTEIFNSTLDHWSGDDFPTKA